jgi:imidazolonepropionase-like amidohydrolase
VIGGDYGFAWTPQGTNARDLKHFVDLFGYSPMDALVCATRWGGELMRMGGELGQVREGYLADLLLVDGNPLADIGIMADRSRFAMIMKDGAIYKDPRTYARDVRIAAE